MSKEVFITGVSKFLPNDLVGNNEMEAYLGMIDNKPSKAKNIILNTNGIVGRYYALDKNGHTTHTNAQMTVKAIKALFIGNTSLDDIELLSCGTGSPDQWLPSHASSVHGLFNNSNIEVHTFIGACCTGMQAFKMGYLSVLSGNTSNAVCTGSERPSKWMQAHLFEKEMEKLNTMKDDPYIAFEKEFLRWMLSDGAGAFLLESKPGNEVSLRVDWIDISSFASQAKACMYTAAEKLDDGELKSWLEFMPEEWLERSLFSVKQDVKLLKENIVELGIKFMKEIVGKRELDLSSFDYFLPHISSMFFKSRIEEAFAREGIDLPYYKWFTNLSTVGNVGSASVYLMVEELIMSGKLKKGDKLLLMVPESARFTYAFSQLTVC